MRSNHCFNIIECAGTPYNTGRQRGEACREHLRQCFTVNTGAITASYGAAVPQTRTPTSFTMCPEDGIMHIAHGNPCRAAYNAYRLA